MKNLRCICILDMYMSRIFYPYLCWAQRLCVSQFDQITRFYPLRDYNEGMLQIHRRIRRHHRIWKLKGWFRG